MGGWRRQCCLEGHGWRASQRKMVWGVGQTRKMNSCEDDRVQNNQCFGAADREGVAQKKHDEGGMAASGAGDARRSVLTLVRALAARQRARVALPPLSCTPSGPRAALAVVAAAGDAARGEARGNPGP